MPLRISCEKQGRVKGPVGQRQGVCFCTGRHFHVCPAYCYGHRPAPDTWRRAGSSGCLRSSLLPPFLGGGFKISPLSPRKLGSLCSLPELEASHLHSSSDAFVPCSAPPSVAAPGFCTLFSWVEWQAAGDADDQGVAAVGMMLGELRLTLWLSPRLSPIIV